MLYLFVNRYSISLISMFSKIFLKEPVGTHMKKCHRHISCLTQSMYESQMKCLYFIKD